MNRLIFRAWDEEAEIYVYSNKQYDDYFFEFKDGELCAFKIVETLGTIYEPLYIQIKNTPSREAIELEPVEQFTMQKDSDNKLIFESDIIQSKSKIIRILSNIPTGKFSIETYEVKWDQEEARWGRYRKGRFELLSGIKQEFMSKWYKIIGNTNENPELLEEENE